MHGEPFSSALHRGGSSDAHPLARTLACHPVSVWRQIAWAGGAPGARGNRAGLVQHLLWGPHWLPHPSITRSLGSSRGLRGGGQSIHTACPPASCLQNIFTAGLDSGGVPCGHCTQMFPKPQDALAAAAPEPHLRRPHGHGSGALRPALPAVEGPTSLHKKDSYLSQLLLPPGGPGDNYHWG